MTHKLWSGLKIRLGGSELDNFLQLSISVCIESLQGDKMMLRDRAKVMEHSLVNL